MTRAVLLAALAAFASHVASAEPSGGASRPGEPPSLSAPAEILSLERPERDYLFRASVPDRGIVVFLPTCELRSPEEAAAYLAWARATHPDKRRAMKAVWDVDAVSLHISQAADAAILHEGDDAVDPSGRIRFTVAKTPGPGASSVELKLVRPSGPGEATPFLCLTNVWILSRDKLVENWRNDFESGKTDTVLAEMQAVRSRFARDGGDAWRDTVQSFESELLAAVASKEEQARAEAEAKARAEAEAKRARAEAEAKARAEAEAKARAEAEAKARAEAEEKARAEAEAKARAEAEAKARAEAEAARRGGSGEAEPPPVGSHAESAEFSEVKSHAASAEPSGGASRPGEPLAQGRGESGSAESAQPPPPWPWQSPHKMHDSVMSWRRKIRDAAKKPNTNRHWNDDRREACDLFDGTGIYGEKLRAAYEHLSRCRGRCRDCKDWIRLFPRQTDPWPSFEKGRRDFLLALVLFDRWNPKEEKPTKNEIDAFFRIVDPEKSAEEKK